MFATISSVGAYCTHWNGWIAVLLSARFGSHAGGAELGDELLGGVGVGSEPAGQVAGEA